MIGLITLGTKQAGKRSAGNPHAPFERAGAGNGVTLTTAPVLDPTVIDGAGGDMLSASGSLALEGQSAIGIGVEQRFDIVSVGGLAPIRWSKLQQTMHGPIG